MLSYVGAEQPCPLWVADMTSLGDLSLSCGPRSGQHQCPLLRIFRPGATLAALVLPRSHFQTRGSCCALDTSECTCCVPDTHQVCQVSFSLKGRLVWPKHPNSGFTSNETGFQKLKTGPNRLEKQFVKLGLSPHLQLLNLGSSSSEKMVREHSPSLFLSIFERFGNSGSLQEPVRPISYKTLVPGGRSLPALVHP